jgi:hypothetical protein
MTQLGLFDPDATRGWVALEDLFAAYYTCRRNKRRTHNALVFELDYESQLVALCDEINNGTYRPGKSVAFIVDKPVKREIFAAEFRDRVGKGTLFGIRGFFMNINTDGLFARLEQLIIDRYHELDRDIVIELCRLVLFARPTENCVIKGRRSDWDGLPPSKSLFYSPPRCGLPIGNLSSQVFANFYLNVFDHFVKHDLGIRFYGRYVDDFVVVHTDHEYLVSLIGVLRCRMLRREVKGWWKYAYTTGSLNKVVLKAKLENKRISTQKR